MPARIVAQSGEGRWIELSAASAGPGRNLQRFAQAAIAAVAGCRSHRPPSKSEYPISQTAELGTRRHSETASYPHRERIGRSGGPAWASRSAMGVRRSGERGCVTPR